MITTLATMCLLVGGLIAWASWSHFGECGSTENNTSLFSSCVSSLPVVQFGKIETAPEFKQTNDIEGLPTTLTRVSDNTHFNASDGEAIHSYSRRQAWNSDESLLKIGDKIIDADSLDIVVEEIPVSSEQVWSSKDPHIIFGLSFVDDVLNNFVAFNTQSNDVEVLSLFDGKKRCSIGRGEGSQSNDDRYILFVCGVQEDVAELISFDIEQKKIVGELVLNEIVNWASFSQSGEFIVVESKPTMDSPRVLTRYAADLTSSMLLSEERHHGDLGIDENGDDVFVMIGGRFITYVRLKDAKVVRLPIAGYSRRAGHGHVSCRNINRPGWCYVSTYLNLVGAVKIAESNNFLGLGLPSTGADRGLAVFEHWGYHESSSGRYQSIPKASASPSGEKIIFTSDWRGNEEINDYIIARKAPSP